MIVRLCYIGFSRGIPRVKCIDLSKDPSTRHLDKLHWTNKTDGLKFVEQKQFYAIHSVNVLTELVHVYLAI